MIDKKGFRLNVGIILVNRDGQVFWGKRVAQDAWQFPQGGLNDYETLEEAMFRELKEEIGLELSDVVILGVTRRWLYYSLPYHYRRHGQRPYCVGQRQRWFLLQLVVPDNRIRFDQTDSPEFDGWEWVDYWYPLEQVISFKRDVYQDALAELEYFLPEG